MKDLTKLSEVNLIFNDLDGVPVFPNSTKTLSICFNPNLKIKSEDLKNLKKLEILKLKANNIKSLPNGFLTHMVRLKEVKLGYFSIQRFCLKLPAKSLTPKLTRLYVFLEVL